MEISYIVDRLNEPPFSKGLRLVEFDEKSPLELIEVLNEVLVAVDPQQATGDARDEPEDVRGSRLMGFLKMLKFDVAPDQQENFQRGLAIGDKTALYPVLHWMLGRLPQLRTRAYLARYLMPLDIPMEFMQDQALADMLFTYRELQAEFKLAHKSVDQGRKGELRPAELKVEITQVEEEKRQLREKIAKLKRSTADEPGFEDMLDVTSRLRKAREEEGRLMEQLQEQRAQLGQAEARLEEGGARLQQLKSSSSSSRSAEAVLVQLRGEVEALQRRALRELPSVVAQHGKTLQELEKARGEPMRTREDVEDAHATVLSIERENASLRQAVEQALANRGDANLTMFRQQAALAAQRLEEKEAKCITVEEEAAQLASEVEMKEQAANLGGSGGGGGDFMNKDEFRAYGARLRDKTQTYKTMKAELSELRSEAVLLQRTEQLLKGRDSRLEEFLAKLESDKGVAGYRKTHAELIAKSEATAVVDLSKAQTLEEISAMVNNIMQELKHRKDRLRPMIEALREARKTAAEVEQEHTRRRGAYEKVAVGLEVERLQLEQQCNDLQAEALQEENRYHYSAALLRINEVRLKKLHQEERWQKGDGKLLPEFKCLKDLYDHKLRQLENLSKGLRRQQRAIKENEPSHTEQCTMYSSLHQLLRCKLNTRARAQADRQGRGNLGDEAFLKAMDNQYGNSGAGGANVMTIDQN